MKLRVMPALTSLRMTADARLPAEGARSGASTANAAGMATSLTAVQMFLMGALGLGVASLLYRVVTAAARRRPIRIDHLESDWIGDQNPQDWQGDQQQHRSVDERNQFTDDLQRSQISGANDRDDQQQHRSVDDRDPFIDDLGRSPLSGVNDYVSGRDNYGARHPYPTDDERPNNVRRTGGASQKVSEREDNLAQLRRDLDWLLQSPKGA